MAPILYSAKAPGSLMLCGEHAVLQNKRAIVFAVDKWIKIKLKPRSDFQVIIYSMLGKVEVHLHTIQIQKPFEFVFAAILCFREQLIFGFELTIDSEFREDVGLGSSAAVTVATVAVLYKFVTEVVGEDWQKILFETAKNIIQTVQGVGSGADVAASVYGGIIQYQQKPPYVLKKLSCLLPLIVIYSGSKTPTPEVVRKVENLQKKYPNIFAMLYETIDYSTVETFLSIEREDWPKVGELLNIQQGLMNSLGVGSPLLNQIVDTLNQESNIYGSKISGSGLGDCIIGIGDRVESKEFFTLSETGVHEIPLSVSLTGLNYE